MQSTQAACADRGACAASGWTSGWGLRTHPTTPRPFMCALARHTPRATNWRPSSARRPRASAARRHVLFSYLAEEDATMAVPFSLEWPETPSDETQTSSGHCTRSDANWNDAA
eukprot:2018821-Prymnesium_polylepis.1